MLQFESSYRMCYLPTPSCDQDPAIHIIFANDPGIMHRSKLHYHAKTDSGSIASSPPQRVPSQIWR